MPLIVLDGPEAAGKTTLVEAIRSHAPGTKIRHWGRLPDDYLADTRYLEPLQEDAASDDLVVWDRSWASGSVYGPHQGRKDRLTADPWAAEWLYGRVADTYGVKAMVLGPSSASLRWRRAERLASGETDDIDIDPCRERYAFLRHARRYGWLVLADQGEGATRRWVGELVSRAVVHYEVARVNGLILPGVTAPMDEVRRCAGPRVLIVGEARNQSGFTTVPGGWLPFTSGYTTRFARVLGPLAMRCAWSNTEDCPPELAASAPNLVLVGDVAARWFRKEVGPREGQNLLFTRHPSWLYRWGRGAGEITGAEMALKEFVRNGVTA